MRHLALLAAVYALAAVLVLPGTPLAQESTDPAATETIPAEPPPDEPAPAEQPPAEPAPAPAQAEPAPAEPAPAPEPEPQVLADEREQPKPERSLKAKAAANGSVTIVDFSFNPGTITINVGDTVTWTNNGPTAHSATSSSFDTGIFPAGQSRSQTFNQAGTFSYVCTPHPNMRGTVVVQAAQTGGETSGSGAADSGATGGTTGEAAQSDGGPTLPNSGADAGALLVLGALMLLLGVAVQRRTRTG